MGGFTSIKEFTCKGRMASTDVVDMTSTDVVDMTSTATTGDNAEKVHGISPPFAPDLPQTSAYSAHTQTHYSIAPVRTDPAQYKFSNVVQNRRHSSMLRFMSVFQTVDLSPKSVKSDSQKEEEAEHRCCCKCCCVLF